MVRRVLGAFVVVLAASTAAQAAARDAIDLSQVTVYNSPPDVASWAVTTSITELHMRPDGDPAAGVSLKFSAQATWPDYTPPDWDGPLQYTVWPIVKINGAYYTSGIIQMWRGRVSTGAPLPSQWYNWAYDSRWGVMNYYSGFHPQTGDLVGFFVTAGNARNVTTVTSVRERSNVVLLSFPAGDTGDWSFPDLPTPTFTGYFGDAKADFDGDGKADIGVFNPSTGQWTGLASSTGFTTSATTNWGTSGDVPVPADYDGDGKGDIAVYRPSTGTWWVLLSSSGFTTYQMFHWGTSTDVPVPGDYDGDGKADVAVYRPSTGGWWILLSSTNSVSSRLLFWGASTDIPVPRDYDGDGKTDVAVYRPSAGTWWILLSTTNSSSYAFYHWGATGDVPVPADYDGDHKADIAVYRPSTGVWWVLSSLANNGTYAAKAFGTNGDIPVPADYDGDGKTDLAVFRPSTNTWWILSPSSGISSSRVFGSVGDVPPFGRQ